MAVGLSTLMEPIHQDVCQGSEPWSPTGARHALYWPGGETVILESKIPLVLPENQTKAMETTSSYTVSMLQERNTSIPCLKPC